jgi:hypothetical protein
LHDLEKNKMNINDFLQRWKTLQMSLYL